MNDIDPRDWGRVILEELLFRAARDIGAGQGTVTVALEFKLAPNQEARSIDITTEGAVEPVIRTSVPLD